ncbi:MAG: hypothetical protein KatS3mg062_1093 [Tepidiforma sp.]|nr:MAG: hypothetical protein KatS3mg062_1093 [Tepidiforma sp.]
MFDLNHHFAAAYADHFVASRRESGRRYRIGRPGPAVGIMTACAAGLRRLAAALEGWSVGSPADLPDIAHPGHRGAH